MIGKIIKWTFWLVVILIIFALLPKGFLDKLKRFVNWDTFLNTLKTGFNNLINFLKEAFGIDFQKIFLKIKNAFGIDFPAIWSGIKNFLANLFGRLANFFK